MKKKIKIKKKKIKKLEEMTLEELKREHSFAISFWSIANWNQEVELEKVKELNNEIVKRMFFEKNNGL